MSADTSHLAQRMYLVCDSVFAFDPSRQLSLFVMQMPSGAQQQQAAAHCTSQLLGAAAELT